MSVFRSRQPRCPAWQPPGQALIHVLILGGILAGAGIWLESVVVPARKLAATLVTKADLGQALANFKQCINDGDSWSLTLHDPANGLQCLLPGGSCASLSKGSIVRLYRADGALCAGLDTSSPAAGFDLSGQPCSGYSVRPGNDGCPYRIQLDWTLVCSGASCPSPQVGVQARVDFSPRTSRNQYPLNLGSNGELQFILTRGIQGAGGGFTVQERMASGMPPAERCQPAASGGSNLISRGLNHVVSDDGPFVRFTSPADGTFTLPAGNYECAGSAPAYRVGRHQLFLMDLTDTKVLLEGSAAFSPPYPIIPTTRSYVQGHFNLPSPARVGLFQACERPVVALGNPALTPAMASDASWASSYSYGVPAGSSATVPEVYAMLGCRVGDNQDL